MISPRKTSVFLFAVIVVLLVAGATACRKGVPPAADIASLQLSLKAAGLQVQPPAAPGLLDSGLFVAQSALIVASKEKVLAYEFPDESSAQAAASKVSPDGSGIGSKYVNWAVKPNYYRRGKLIAIYDGKAKPMTDALTAAMGPRFAGG